jgi:Glycosyltransferase family 25 (LPS biosynthesis protein)
MKIADLPAWCLNLDRRPDRRLRAWDQFRRHRMKVTRVAGMDAAAVEEARGYGHKGHRACALGHRLAWRQARLAGSEAVIVFEDDVVLAPDFRARLEALDLPEDWEVFYFGCVFGQPGPEVLAGGLLKVTGPTWDMHAYAIRASLWPQVSRALGAMSRRRRAGSSLPACDMVLATFHKKHAAYSVWPPMAWQVLGLSNNENGVRGSYGPDGYPGLNAATAHLPRPCVRREIVHPAPVRLPGGEPPGLRQPPRPLHLRQEGYEAEFDRHTLFYDVFHEPGGAVKWIGPPLLNLRPWLEAAGCRDRVPLQIEELALCSRVTRPGVMQSGTLITGEGFSFPVTPEKNHSPWFAGHRVLFTLQKDNRPEWIRDWVAFHVQHHGANAVLLYDNDSTLTTPDELLEVVAGVPGVTTAAVVAWPFPYGPQAGDSGRWDSNFCQHGALEHARWRFLAQARSVLNCDVDECVLTPGGPSVFALAERSRSGVVAFPGQWCVHCPAEGAPAPALVRHRDHHHVVDQPRCPPKWAAVPSRIPPSAQWTTHVVAGVVNEEAPGVSYRHFRGISNSWKYPRPAWEAFNPAIHLPDADLARALEALSL